MINLLESQANRCNIVYEVIWVIYIKAMKLSGYVSFIIYYIQFNAGSMFTVQNVHYLHIDIICVNIKQVSFMSAGSGLLLNNTTVFVGQKISPKYVDWHCYNIKSYYIYFLVVSP